MTDAPPPSDDDDVKLYASDYSPAMVAILSQALTDAAPAAATDNAVIHGSGAERTGSASRADLPFAIGDWAASLAVAQDATLASASPAGSPPDPSVSPGLTALGGGTRTGIGVVGSTEPGAPGGEGQETSSSSYAMTAETQAGSSTTAESDHPYDAARALATLASKNVNATDVITISAAAQRAGVSTEAGTELGDALLDAIPRAAENTERPLIAQLEHGDLQTVLRITLAAEKQTQLLGLQDGLTGTAFGDAAAAAIQRATVAEQARLVQVFGDPALATDPAKANLALQTALGMERQAEFLGVTGPSGTSFAKNTPLGDAMADAVQRIAVARGDPNGGLAALAATWGHDSSLPVPSNMNALQGLMATFTPGVSSGPPQHSAIGDMLQGLTTGRPGAAGGTGAPATGMGAPATGMSAPADATAQHGALSDTGGFEFGPQPIAPDAGSEGPSTGPGALPSGANEAASPTAPMSDIDAALAALKPSDESAPESMSPKGDIPTGVPSSPDMSSFGDHSSSSPSTPSEPETISFDAPLITGGTTEQRGDQGARTTRDDGSVVYTDQNGNVVYDSRTDGGGGTETGAGGKAGTGTGGDTPPAGGGAKVGPDELAGHDPSTSKDDSTTTTDSTDAKSPPTDDHTSDVDHAGGSHVADDTSGAYVNPDAAESGGTARFVLGGDPGVGIERITAHGGDPINPNSGLGGDSATDGTIHVTPTAGPDVNPDADGPSGTTARFVGTGSGSTSSIHQPLGGDPINPALDPGSGPLPPPVDDGVNPYAASFAATMAATVSEAATASSGSASGAGAPEATTSHTAVSTGVRSAPAPAVNSDVSVDTAVGGTARIDTSGVSIVSEPSIESASLAPAHVDAPAAAAEPAAGVQVDAPAADIHVSAGAADVHVDAPAAAAEPAAAVHEDAPATDLHVSAAVAPAEVAPQVVEAASPDQSQLGHVDPGLSANEPPPDASDLNPQDGSPP